MLKGPPSYCRHKASGQAVVRIHGKDVYLGVYGSEESYERYERSIAEWRSNLSTAGHGIQPIDLPARSIHATIDEVLLRYLEFAKEHYVDAQGKRTREYSSMIEALRPLRRLYGSTSMRDFGPLALKNIQRQLAESGRLCRGVINRRVNRIRRFVKWAVSEELAPPAAYQALSTVVGLKRGQFSVREAPGVRAVNRSNVEAVLEVASPVLSAMIKLQLSGGMRPAEITNMRPIDIDQSETVWKYQPHEHKNRWRGKDRAPILLGAQSQAILTPFLERDPESYCFSPREAEANRAAKLRRDRKSRLTPSQRQRDSLRKDKAQKRALRERYDVDSYRRAIKYAIEHVNRKRKAEGLELITKWSPLQLRHTRATEIRSRYGLEAAQVFLGHDRADVTQIYAERDLAMAIRIAQEIG